MRNNIHLAVLRVTEGVSTQWDEIKSLAQGSLGKIRVFLCHILC